MSYIAKWAYVNKTYAKTSRAKIVRRMYAFSSWRQNGLYWLALTGYLLTAAVALIFLGKSPVLLFSVVIVNGIIYFWVLERRLSKDLAHIYEEYGLRDHPLFFRPRYLHFVTFRELLNEAGIIKPEEVSNLLAWDEIRNEKVSIVPFFDNKFFLVGFTALVTLGVKSLTNVEFAPQDWVVVFYLAFVLLSLSWLIFDVSKIRLRQRVDLNRFLKWYEMEERALGSEAENNQAIE